MYRLLRLVPQHWLVRFIALLSESEFDELLDRVEFEQSMQQRKQLPVAVPRCPAVPVRTAEEDAEFYKDDVNVFDGTGDNVVSGIIAPPAKGKDYEWGSVDRNGTFKPANNQPGEGTLP